MTSRPRWVTVAGWFVASRLVIAMLGVAGVATFATIEDGKSGRVYDNTDALNPENVWHKWDSIWYQRVATYGYGHELDTTKGRATAGYFPLYPLSVRAVQSAMPSVPFFWVGSILSSLFTLAALWLLAQRLIDREDLTGRVMAVMLMSAGSFYLSIPYTEGLFILLVVGTMVATRARRYEVAGLLAGLAAVTRAHGLPLIAVPVVACWLDQQVSRPAKLPRLAAATLLFGAPVLAYLVHLQVMQGDWSAMFSRQEMWGNPSPVPFQAFAGLFQFPTRISGWLHGGFWVLYAALLVRYWRQIPIGEVVFCAGVLLITTQQEGFHGTYRYMLTLVPLALAIAKDRDQVRLGVIAVNLIFGVLMLLAFVTNNRLTV